MLLHKKNINNSIIECLYDSSNVLKSIFDKDKKELTIIFKSGGVYKYKNVRFIDYDKFELLESQGKALNKYIKGFYEFEKLEPMDVSSILSEANIYIK